ncbi:MAG: hypothetical protein ACW99Q_24610, partial [Candidatus Kariarchaeaceae archaeon]
MYVHPHYLWPICIKKGELVLYYYEHKRAFIRRPAMEPITFSTTYQCHTVEIPPHIWGLIVLFKRMH